MADRKVTVLNPLGYQELFQSGDNLVFDGSLNLQSNSITGVPTPVQDVDGVNKKYVDDADDTISGDIDSLTIRINDLESDVDDLEDRPAPGDGEVTLTGTAGITITGDNPFRLNQSSDVAISLQGPDLSSFLNKPTTDGDFIITKDGDNITYNTLIDLGNY
jgi:hypothetical protein